MVPWLCAAKRDGHQERPVADANPSNDEYLAGQHLLPVLGRALQLALAERPVDMATLVAELLEDDVALIETAPDGWAGRAAEYAEEQQIEKKLERALQVRAALRRREPLVLCSLTGSRGPALRPSSKSGPQTRARASPSFSAPLKKLKSSKVTEMLPRVSSWQRESPPSWRAATTRTATMASRGNASATASQRRLRLRRNFLAFSGVCTSAAASRRASSIYRATPRKADVGLGGGRAGARAHPAG